MHVKKCTERSGQLSPMFSTLLPNVQYECPQRWGHFFVSCFASLYFLFHLTFVLAEIPFYVWIIFIIYRIIASDVRMAKMKMDMAVIPSTRFRALP